MHFVSYELVKLAHTNYDNSSPDTKLYRGSWSKPFEYSNKSLPAALLQKYVSVSCVVFSLHFWYTGDRTAELPLSLGCWLVRQVDCLGSSCQRCCNPHKQCWHHNHLWHASAGHINWAEVIYIICCQTLIQVRNHVSDPAVIFKRKHSFAFFVGVVSATFTWQIMLLLRTGCSRQKASPGGEGQAGQGRQRTPSHSSTWLWRKEGSCPQRRIFAGTSFPADTHGCYASLANAFCLLQWFECLVNSNMIADMPFRLSFPRARQAMWEDDSFYFYRIAQVSFTREKAGFDGFPYQTIEMQVTGRCRHFKDIMFPPERSQASSFW